LVDIFDEVSDDLRTERALRLARRYGGLLILACILVLVAVGGSQYLTWRQSQDAQKAAARYLAITGPIDAAAPPTGDAAARDADALSGFAAQAPSGYAALAQLRAAALYEAAGQPAKANALWAALGHDGPDSLLSDLARLLWAQHNIGVAADTDVHDELAPLLKADNPYEALAHETQALLDLHAGKTNIAKAEFTTLLADPAAPAGVRNRASGLLAQLNG
jgi:hypothetical protein